MPIPVQCQCGTKLRAPDAAAGKRVKCPKCGAPIAVPTAASTAPPVSASPATPKSAAAKAVPRGPAPPAPKSPPQAATTRCPQCKAEAPPGALLCVVCGFNFKTGKQLRTHGRTQSVKPPAGSSPPGESPSSMTPSSMTPLSISEEMLAKAEHELATTPVKADDYFASTSGNWGLAAICFCVAVLVISGSVALFNYLEAGRSRDPTDKRSVEEKKQDIQVRVIEPTMQAALITVASLGGLMGVAGWVSVVRNGYKDTPLQGMLCLVGIVYYVVYGIANPRKNLTATMISVSGFVLLGIAAGIYFALRRQGML